MFAHTEALDSKGLKAKYGLDMGHRLLFLSFFLWFGCYGKDITGLNGVEDLRHTDVHAYQYLSSGVRSVGKMLQC